MPIEPVANQEPEKKTPLLSIQLPAPVMGNPNAPLSVGQHNAAAQHNFQQVADILLTIVNNQKIMGLAIAKISEDIAKFLRKKGDENADNTASK